MQQTLFAVRLVQEDAACGTRDLRCTGVDAAGQRYALRTTDDPQPLAPLTEWLCYHLCQRCGIYQPGFAIVERVDGSPAFGSVWVEDAWQYSPAAHTTLQLEGWLRRTADDASAMFALDAFLPNADRHLRNVLFRQVGPRTRAMAFDWSDVRLPLQTWPWPQDCNSARVLAWLRDIGAWQPGAAQAVLQRLEAISAADVNAIMNAAPPSWRHNQAVGATTGWWHTHALSRVAKTAAFLGLKP